MKYPREDLITATMNARERHASVLYKQEDIEQNIQAAAGKGGGHLHISQKLPYTLKDTHSAKVLVQWAEENKYSIHWAPKIKKLTSGVYQHYRELVIWWVDYDTSLTPQELADLQELLNLHMLNHDLQKLPKPNGAIIERYNAAKKPREINCEPSL